MKWIAASILCSAAVVSYFITMPFRDCVAGYVIQSKSSDAVSRGMAAMTCHIGRG